MAYDFSSRLNYLGTRMKDLHQNSLVYSRSGNPDISVTNFTPEALAVEQMMYYGLTSVTGKYQDFIFDSSKLSGLATPSPLPGDQITWNNKVFQVVRLGGQVGSPTEGETYRYTTSTRERMRVHTVQVG